MSLNNGANATDRVVVTSTATITTMTTFTVIGWFNPTSLANSRRLFQKGTAVGTGWQLTHDSTGQLGFRVGCATTTSNYGTNTAPFATTPKWYCVAAIWRGTGASGSDIYVGDCLTPIAVQTYAANTDGSGAQVSDSGLAFATGNNNAGSSTAFVGDMGAAAIFTRALTVGEMIDWQYRRLFGPNCVLYHEYGFNGVSTQTDYSGNGHSGTVTGATQAGHVPTMAPFGMRAPWINAEAAAPPAGGNPWYHYRQMAG